MGNKFSTSTPEASLLEAATNGQTNKVRRLIVAGADVNYAEERYLKTALMEAAWYGHQDIAELLIQAGADVNARSIAGGTTLMNAARHDNVKLTRLLLRLGVKVNFKVNTHSGLFNALTYNISFREPVMEIVMILLAAGEDVNADVLKTIGRDKGFKSDCLNIKQPTLKHLCRETIREHLLKLDRHENLFTRIPLLGTPKLITYYLLYHVSLDDDGKHVNRVVP